MKIHIESLSMPQLITADNFKFETLSDRKAFLEKLLAKKSCIKIGMYKEYDLYHTGSTGSKGYYFLSDSDITDLYYVCKYVTRKVISDKAMSQVIVYRNPEVWVGTRGIVQYVMDNILLPKFGIILCDTQQTLDGRRLWMASMVRALARGKYVYFYDVLRRKLSRIKSADGLDSYAKVAWSYEAKSRHHLFLISLTKIEGV